MRATRAPDGKTRYREGNREEARKSRPPVRNGTRREALIPFLKNRDITRGKKVVKRGGRGVKNQGGMRDRARG